MRDLYYTFKSTGSTNVKDNFQLFLDTKGNILSNNDLEYGIYNKIISINIQKFLFVKIKKVGFGDIIDFITKKTGLKWLIMYLTKGNCGCEARRIKFNKVKIPYWITIKLRQLYDSDYRVLNHNDNIILKKLQVKEEKEKTFIPPPNKKINETKPLTQDQIKKSCGCGRKG